jgi:hypothetical protein
MTHGRMQMMTQGRKAISMAHRAALGCLAVARQLLVVVMVVSIVALVAGTAGTSYAKKKGPGPNKQLHDTVVVSNFASLFAGSIETFAAGAIHNSAPLRNIIGSNTLLGDGNGAAGDAQSSLNGDIAVGVPLGLAGVLPNGFVEIYSSGDNGNTPPEVVIGSLTPFGAPDLTGLSLPQGVAFANPFIELAASASIVQLDPPDVLAVANFTPVVIGPDLGIPGLGLCAPNAPGFSLGTITEYDTAGLATFNVTTFGGVNDIFPINNSPVTALSSATPPVPFAHNATIGGCDTFLLGPVGLAFDSAGFLYVVNEIGKYVTVYAPGAFGNAVPVAIIGAFGATTGAFVDPQFITVSGSGEGATIYVTDAGDNSIKVFSPFTNFVSFTDTGTQLGTIAGGHTKLKRPLGIAISGRGDLYVVNNNANSLEMFVDVFDSGFGNLRPNLIIQGKPARMNFPVGVALPQFSRPD